MRTRLLTSDDLLEFRALWLDGLRRFPLAFLWDASDIEALPDARLVQMLETGNFIGVFDGTLIGFACLRADTIPRTKHRASLGPFYVAPDHQGAGAADLLMAACIDTATRQECWLIDLYVAVENPRAIRFYERHGFMHEGRMPAAIVVDDISHDDFYYCLTLAH